MTRFRETCQGDDLCRYLPGEIPGIDGVIWTDGKISWVGGGRSTAAAEGIDC